MKKLSSSAPTTKDDNTSGNILMHHSRDTAEKQWAETRVLTLAGVARTFTAQRKVLQGFYSKIYMFLEVELFILYLEFTGQSELMTGQDIPVNFKHTFLISSQKQKV